MTAKDFGKVAVLMGGPSSEREISFLSGNAVLGALREKGVDAHPFDPAVRDLFELKEAPHRIYAKKAAPARVMPWFTNTLFKTGAAPAYQRPSPPESRWNRAAFGLSPLGQRPGKP